MTAERGVRRSPGLIIAAGLTWIPAVAILVSRVASHGLPSTLPWNWNDAAQVSTWSRVPFVFGLDFGIALACSVLSTLVVITVGDDLDRVKGGFGLGFAVLIASGNALSWFGSVAVAEHTAGVGAALGLSWFAGFVLGALVFGAVALPRRAPVDRSNGGEDAPETLRPAEDSTEHGTASEN